MASVDVNIHANDVLSAHVALLQRVRHTQQLDRWRLSASFPESSRPAVVSAILNKAGIDATNIDVSKLVHTLSPLLPGRALPERPDLHPGKRAKLARYSNYIPEEETIRNDYSQHYVDTGEWPQTWVQGAELERRFEEYPKQRRLLSLKREAVSTVAHPPMYLSHATGLTAASHTTLINHFALLKFDVIVLDPFHSPSAWSWEELATLPVPQLAGDPSFVFMWVGDGSDDGLEKGREVLAKWGYRRCEDIVWIKTNRSSNGGPGTDPPTSSLLTHTKEHCLMGIRGTVRRSTDSWFVHCNIDTDIIIWEGDPKDPTRKPPEMYNLIENFCLGMRRLELFGRPSSVRRGWLTVGDFDRKDVQGEVADWDLQAYESHFSEGIRNVVPNTHEIEILRPKSPNRGNSNNLLAPPPNTQRAVLRPASIQSVGAPFIQHQQPTANVIVGGMGQPMSVQMAYHQQVQAQQAQAASAGYGMFGTGDGSYGMGGGGYGIGWMPDGGNIGTMAGVNTGMGGVMGGMNPAAMGGMNPAMGGIGIAMGVGSGMGMGAPMGMGGGMMGGMGGMSPGMNAGVNPGINPGMNGMGGMGMGEGMWGNDGQGMGGWPGQQGWQG